METLQIRRPRLSLLGIPAVVLLAKIIDGLSGWRSRARERRQLSALSDGMLKDIGISRADASAEFEKPFWRS